MSAGNLVARQVTVRAPRISITATFGAVPAVIYQILGSAGLPAPTFQVARPQPAADLLGRLLASSPARRGPVPAPPLPPAIGNYSGLGFDTCAAPGYRNMRVWRRASRYRAIGIYIGGADRTCAQPNLTRAWLRAEVVAGWRPIPLYAGPQADFGELVAPAFTSQQTPAVNVPDGSTMVFYLRSGRHLWLDLHTRGRGWTGPVPAGVRAWSVPSANSPGMACCGRWG